MKKQIAVVAGGDSSEKVISMKTAAVISQHLNESRDYEAIPVFIGDRKWEVHIGDEKYVVDKNDFSFSKNGNKQIFNAVFIAIHGTPGEDGKLQGYFDLIGMPYTSCGVLNSAVTFNKWYCNSLLRQMGFNCAESYLLRANKYSEAQVKEIADKVGFPCFVKPNNGGSSFGVTKVKSIDGLNQAIDSALEHNDEVMIEKLMSGKEVTCGLLPKNSKVYPLPLTEIVYKGEFFDYKAKYEGDSEEITPARLSEELTKKTQQTAVQVYQQLDLKGLVRIDFIIQNDEPFIIEINTVPGLSAESIVPQQAKVVGMTLQELFVTALEECLIK